jgi:hypothetical protein
LTHQKSVGLLRLLVNGASKGNQSRLFALILDACIAIEDPLVGSIAQQLLTDKEGHDKLAAEWTKRYAQG